MAVVHNRGYLLAVAASAMRQVLVDHARRRMARKRGGGKNRLPLEAVREAFDEHGFDVIDLHESIEQLARIIAVRPRSSGFATMEEWTVREVAESLAVSVTTVEDDWRFARAWLFSRLDEGNRP